MLFKDLVCLMRWLPQKAYLDVEVIFTVDSYPLPSLCVLWEAQGLNRVVAIWLTFWKAKEPHTKWPASYFRHCCRRSRKVLICLLTFHQSTHTSKFLPSLGIKRPYSESVFLPIIFQKDTRLFESWFDVFGKFMSNVLTEKLPGDFFHKACIFCNVHKFSKSRNNACKFRDYSNSPW